MDHEITSLAQLGELVTELLPAGTDERRMLGIVGPPGAGKSTLAELLLTAAGDRAALLPMDGYHLADETLARLGRSERKGAPDTFDVAGYLGALARLRRREHVYAPRFDRELEAAIAGALDLAARTPLIITEGNYLLLESGDGDGWAEVRPLLDEVWYLDVDERLRTERLVARHRRFGRTEADARAWVEQVDEPNARLVARGRGRADRVIRLSAPLS